MRIVWIGLLSIALAGCSAVGGGMTRVPFTDPRTGQTSVVYPGFVSLHYLPSHLPWSDSNYFDNVATQPEGYLDAYYAWLYGGYHNDPLLQEFVAAENVEVVEWWEMGAGVDVALPESTTLEEAITRWPVEYGHIFDAVSPVYVTTKGGYVPYLD